MPGVSFMSTLQDFLVSVLFRRSAFHMGPKTIPGSLAPQNRILKLLLETLSKEERVRKTRLHYGSAMEITY